MSEVEIPSAEGIEFSPLAHIFPMMNESEHATLTDDIKRNGLRHPIIVDHEGRIIDGRNRFLGCQKAGVDPRFETLPEGQDALAYVISVNFARRHLSESQRALSAARLIEHGVERADAAKQFKVTPSAVTAGTTVLKRGIQELESAVAEDRIPVNIAAKLAGLPEHVQHDAVGLKPKDLRGVVKRVARAKKTANLAKATRKASEQLGTKQYSVIYADPPWQYQVWSENGKDRSAENHYPTMATADIAAMQVPSAKDAVLFLWATVPMLEMALSVIAAWGFTYKSQFVWVKEDAGTGHWNRNRHELLLIGTKGNVPAPDPSDRDDSVIEEAATEHSTKPAVVYEMLEKYYPNLPRIELFARRFRSGWDSHGAELDEITHGQPDDEQEQPAAA